MKGISEIGVLFCGTCCVVYSDICIYLSHHFQTWYTKSTQEWACLPGSRLRNKLRQSWFCWTFDEIILNRLDMIGYWPCRAAEKFCDAGGLQMASHWLALPILHGAKGHGKHGHVRSIEHYWRVTSCDPLAYLAHFERTPNIQILQGICQSFWLYNALQAEREFLQILGI